MKIIAMKIHELLFLVLLLLCGVLVGQRWFHSPMLFALLLVLVGSFSYFFMILWLKPERVRQKLRRQGIGGPKPCLLYGNVPEMQRIVVASAAAAQNKADDAKDGDHARFIAHDYTSTLFPYFEQWRKQYGTVYTYSTGNKQHLYVNNAEIVKEMNQSISLNLGKPTYVTKRLAPMLGNGILRANGQLWFQQRKIVAPELFMNKIKGMVGLMIESTESLLTKWSLSIEEQGSNVADIGVDEDLRNISADVISRACFGSSYFKGKEIFHKLRLLQKTISKQAVLFGLSSFGSTFLNGGQQKTIKSLETEIDGLIWDAVKERKNECFEDLSSSTTEKDLMQLILEGAVNDRFTESNSKRFIVDNCKNIYFAGHESTAVASSWCLMMLALHPEWQSRVRNEMAEVCQDGLLTSDSLAQMKSVTMVIQETMRLYPPAAFVSREALEDIQLGNLSVPKGVCTWTLIPTLHRDPDIWGKDANEFKPERFEKGVSGACKVPHAYVPFGLGPRLCLGRNFAMVQLKVILSMIISRFTFSLSPNYQHSPTYRMIVEPGNGVHIVISKLE